MPDPRSANTTQFKLDGSGKVVGVELVYLPHETSRYVLTQCSLRDEYAAQGQTIASVNVLDKEGRAVLDAGVYLAWPWKDWKPGWQMSERHAATNGNYPFEHVISNGYNPPGQGPLSIYVGDKNGNVASDVIGGLGLPMNRHVSYWLVFQERGAVVPPVEPPGTGDIAEVLARIEAKIDRIGVHFT